MRCILNIACRKPYGQCLHDLGDDIAVIREPKASRSTRQRQFAKIMRSTWLLDLVAIDDADALPMQSDVAWHVNQRQIMITNSRQRLQG